MNSISKIKWVLHRTEDKRNISKIEKSVSFVAWSESPNEVVRLTRRKLWNAVRTHRIFYASNFQFDCINKWFWVPFFVFATVSIRKCCFHLMPSLCNWKRKQSTKFSSEKYKDFPQSNRFSSTDKKHLQHFDWVSIQWKQTQRLIYGKLCWNVRCASQMKWFVQEKMISFEMLFAAAATHMWRTFETSKSVFEPKFLIAILLVPLINSFQHDEHFI